MIEVWAWHDKVKKYVTERLFSGIEQMFNQIADINVSYVVSICSIVWTRQFLQAQAIGL